MAPGVVEVGPASGPQVELKVQEPSQKKPSHDVADHEEYQYLNLIRDIIDNGEHRPDRTGTGTYSIFAPRPMVFSLSRPTTSSTPSTERTPILPLLTTKRVFLRAVTTELLWFLSGCTSSLPLSAQGIKIWDGNGSRAYLDSIGLTHRAEGDLGPVYGFQWRHFGAEYKDAAADYTGQGVDQLKEVIHKLTHTPWDRRIVLSAWNPADLSKMALPPCHMFAQFYVSYPRRKGRRADASDGPKQGETNGAAIGAGGEHAQEENGKGTLHCQLYQRSCDMGLGIPFNIASYALLTHMLAHVCDLQPGSLTHVMGDAHVYVDHVGALEAQLERQPREFPELELAPKGDERRRGAADVAAMEGWQVEDFVVKGYKPHGKIEMKMSV